MTDPLDRGDDGNRYLGSGLTRSGDPALFVRGLARALGWILIALVRAARFLYDGARHLLGRSG